MVWKTQATGYDLDSPSAPTLAIHTLTMPGTVDVEVTLRHLVPGCPGIALVIWNAQGRRHRR